MAREEEEYRGHAIEIKDEGEDTVVRIDGKEHAAGRTTGGEYFLEAYAYDRDEDLMAVVERYLDYLERTEGSEE